MKLLIISFVVLVMMGCQFKPTTLMEQSVNVYADNTVLVDTRDSFLYQSYHIPGSVNLVSSDFLVLKNPKKRLHVLDPNMQQIIKRLALKGVSPQKRIILLSDVKQSSESKKWRWFLKNLDVENVVLTTIAEFKKNQKNNSFSEPTPVEEWVLNISEDLQNEFIYKKSKDCFINWSESKCN